MTPAQLLGASLQNTTIAILAYHYLPDNMYSEVRIRVSSMRGDTHASKRTTREDHAAEPQAGPLDLERDMGRQLGSVFGVGMQQRLNTFPFACRRNWWETPASRLV